MNFLKILYLGLVKLLGKIQAVILISLFYFLIIPLFIFIRIRDLLNNMKTSGASYWRDKKRLTTGFFARGGSAFGGNRLI